MEDDEIIDLFLDKLDIYYNRIKKKGPIERLIPLLE